MFRRRVFYDAATGEVLRTSIMKGMLNPNHTAALEADALGLTNCSCMEWTDPDAAIEAAFEPVDADGNPRIVNVSVDVSGAEPQLVFEYAAVPEPEQEQSEAEDMAAALALLGVMPEVNNA